MQTERLNRLSFFFFMGTLAFGTGRFPSAFASNNEEVADPFLRFLRSAAGQEVAAKYRNLKKAPTG